MIILTDHGEALGMQHNLINGELHLYNWRPSEIVELTSRVRRRVKCVGLLAIDETTYRVIGLTSIEAGIFAKLCVELGSVERH